MTWIIFGSCLFLLVYIFFVVAACILSSMITRGEDNGQ